MRRRPMPIEVLLCLFKRFLWALIKCYEHADSIIIDCDRWSCYVYHRRQMALSLLWFLQYILKTAAYMGVFIVISRHLKLL